MEEYGNYVKDSEEMIRQIEDDSDREVVAMKRNYEKELAEEKNFVEV